MSRIYVPRKKIIFWLVAILVFVSLLPMNWPVPVTKAMIYTTGTLSGIPLKHLGLYTTHLGFESNLRQYNEDIPLPGGFSLGGTLVSDGANGDIGIGQISPIYFDDNVWIRWCTLCNLSVSAKYFAQGCTKEDCSATAMVSHYTGKPTGDFRVTRTLAAASTEGDASSDQKTARIIFFGAFAIIGVFILKRRFIG